MTTVTAPLETIIIDGWTFRLPFADLLPALSQEEMEELTNDIRQRGIQVPIMIAAVSQDCWDVIDGQHRLRAAAALGIRRLDIPLKVMKGTPDELAALAFDLNVKRRHLTKEQRRDAAAKLRQAGLSYRQIAERMGVSPETARRDVLEDGDQPDTITGADGKQYDAVSEETKIKRARELVLALVESGQAVNAQVLDGSPDFAKTGIASRRILSILVGDNLIIPDGKGSYKLTVTDETLEKVRAALMAAPGRRASVSDLWRKNIGIVPAQIAMNLQRLVEQGDVRAPAISNGTWEMITTPAADPAPSELPAAVEATKPAGAQWIPDADPDAVRTTIVKVLTAQGGLTVTKLVDAVKKDLGSDYLGSGWTAAFETLKDTGVIHAVRRGEVNFYELVPDLDAAPAETAPESSENNTLYAVGTYVKWRGRHTMTTHVGIVREHVDGGLKIETWTLAGENHDTRVVKMEEVHTALTDNEYERCWTFVTRRFADELLCVEWKDHYLTLDWNKDINCHRYNFSVREKWDRGLAARVSRQYIDHVLEHGGSVQVFKLDDLDARMQDIFSRAGRARGGEVLYPPVPDESAAQDQTADVSPDSPPLSVDVVREFMIEVFTEWKNRGLGENELIKRTVKQAHGIDPVTVKKALDAMLEAGTVLQFQNGHNWTLYQLKDYAESILAANSPAQRVADQVSSALESLCEDIDFVIDFSADWSELADYARAALAARAESTRAAVQRLSEYLDTLPTLPAAPAAEPV